MSTRAELSSLLQERFEAAALWLLEKSEFNLDLEPWEDEAVDLLFELRRSVADVPDHLLDESLALRRTRGAAVFDRRLLDAVQDVGVRSFPKDATAFLEAFNLGMACLE